MMPLLFLALFFLWLAFFGGTVGSFLNVVVYRVPAGMSVVHPPSRCPRCEHAIRWYDNIPVLGWLWLRGRCRDCSKPISPRYPIVEAITAAMFVAVAWADGLHTMWLESFVTVRGAFVAETFYFVCGLYLLHVTLVCTLWSAALMQYDGHIPPARLLIPAAIVIGLGAGGLDYYHRTHSPPGHVLFPIAEQIVCGILMAAFAMLTTFFWTWIETEREKSRWSFVELIAICGFVIHPGSMVLVIAWSVLIGLAVVLINRRSNYPLLCLLAGVMINLVLGQYYEPFLRRFDQWAFLQNLPAGIVPPAIYFAAFSLLVLMLNEVCFMIRWRVKRDNASD